MGNTKERILMTALRLFAQCGYEAASVSAIAQELQMTKGALYRHYKSKRDIFDSIVERMYEIDAQRAVQFEVPAKLYSVSPAEYKSTSIESVKSFTLSQFLFWTQDEFAADFRRMLALEQYRSREMAELYSQCLSAGPIAYVEDIFREMIVGGTLRPADPHLLAVEFYAPVFLLINVSDNSTSNAELVDTLSRHIEKFFKSNEVDSKNDWR